MKNLVLHKWRHMQLTLEQMTLSINHCAVWVIGGQFGKEPATSKGTCFASNMSDEFKVAGWTYDRPGWDMRIYLGIIHGKRMSKHSRRQ
jgi:hypothetical protein